MALWGEVAHSPRRFPPGLRSKGKNESKFESPICFFNQQYIFQNSSIVTDCDEVQEILGMAEELDLTVMRGYMKPDPDEDR